MNLHGSHFFVSILFHVGSELIEDVLKTSDSYYNLTNNIYLSLQQRHKNDVCMTRIVGLFRDESKLKLWRERYAVDISIKMIISFMSFMAAILLNICEYFGYLTNNKALFTSKHCAEAALRLGISFLIELILYICLYYLWYEGKGALVEPFERIIESIRSRSKFVWIFMACYIVAGLTYSGKNI